MTLSMLFAPTIDPVEALPRAAAGPRVTRVPLPASLASFGTSILATEDGAADGTPIVVLGGISANAFPSRGPGGATGWWPGFVGPGGAVDPARHRIIGIGFAADEEGLLAPSTADQAEMVLAALDALGVAEPVTLVGASYGAMVGLALAERCPERVARLVVISAAATPHPAATAWRELQRRVIALGLRCGTPDEALGIARGMGMLSYRTSEEFAERFTGGISGAATASGSEPGDYLRHCGASFGTRMSPGRYLSLSASIDRHRVDPAAIRAPTLLIGVTSDQLVRPEQLSALADSLAGPATLHLVESLYGHDAFLKEAGRMADLVRPFLEARA